MRCTRDLFVWSPKNRSASWMTQLASSSGLDAENIWKTCRKHALTDMNRSDTSRCIDRLDKHRVKLILD